jgi:hypothetical protein
MDRTLGLLLQVTGPVVGIENGRGDDGAVRIAVDETQRDTVFLCGGSACHVGARIGQAMRMKRDALPSFVPLSNGSLIL